MILKECEKNEKGQKRLHIGYKNKWNILFLTFDYDVILLIFIIFVPFQTIMNLYYRLQSMISVL